MFRQFLLHLAGLGLLLCPAFCAADRSSTSEGVGVRSCDCGCHGPGQEERGPQAPDDEPDCVISHGSVAPDSKSVVEFVRAFDGEFFGHIEDDSSLVRLVGVVHRPDSVRTAADVPLRLLVCALLL